MTRVDGQGSDDRHRRVSFTRRLPAAEARRRDARCVGHRAVTRARNALNGHQKGHCFYCFGPIGVIAGRADLGEVDHLFPHALKGTGIAQPVDGVWNLVLARSNCNGWNAKSSRVPRSSTSSV